MYLDPVPADEAGDHLDQLTALFGVEGIDQLPWRAKDLLETDDEPARSPMWRRVGWKGASAVAAALVVVVAFAGIQLSESRQGSKADDALAAPTSTAPATDPTSPDSTPAPSTAAGPPTTAAGDPAATAPTTAPPPAPGSSAPATSAPAAGTPAQGGSAAAQTGSYQTNLALVHAQAVRNRNQDDSRFLKTPSEQLNPEDHYGPRSDYLNNPAGNPEQAFPVVEGGQFRVACEFSHFAYDDPLVFPGQPGASHLHTFFGNTDANAFSTADSILNTGGSTCNGQELNRTSYWVPALFDSNGNVRIPERLVVYYKGEGLANGKAEPYPTGAAMIAKVDLNTVDNGRGGAMGKFSFNCSDNYSSNGGESANTMVGCDGSLFQKLFGAADPHVVLEMNVKFPQCWNGKDPSNPANYAAPTEGGWYFSNCTGEFNRTLTNLEYFVDYPVEPGENTSDWYLSSDVDPTSKALRPGPRGASNHADWMSGWNKATNKMWIDNCVNFRTSEPSGCGFGYLTNGGPDGNNPQPGPALKYREQFTGPFKVPASQIVAELCPGGGNLANATAAAYCKPGTAVVRAGLGSSPFCMTPPTMVGALPNRDERAPAAAGVRVT
ncbi:MAG: DUF1996 domain-containing protein [Acidimicrobiia bacterium]|nr:DUF1996 domain-containing protein [Acidimicrobiia bacterium]